MKKIFIKRGFTLVELLVVISIIGILSSIVYANLSNGRAAARDEIRKTSLKELQLALELYKAQHGVYPDQGCNSSNWAGPGPQPGWGCTVEEYIKDLSPGFIPELPKDPVSEYNNGYGFIYTSDGNDYKLMVNGSVEVKKINSYSDEFARCPYQVSPGCTNTNPPNYTYAVYSPGAVSW